MKNTGSIKTTIQNWLLQMLMLVKVYFRKERCSPDIGTSVNELTSGEVSGFEIACTCTIYGFAHLECQSTLGMPPAINLPAGMPPAINIPAGMPPKVNIPAGMPPNQ